jgi:hypothetical protein
MKKLILVLLLVVFLSQVMIAEAALYETSFEDYTEADEPANGKWADRGGNWRVNKPSHTGDYTTYDATGVRTGERSIHVWGEKAWQWGNAVQLQLPYGEYDEKSEEWIPGNSQSRSITMVHDLLYYPSGTPDTLIADATPNEIGRWHWSHDWMWWDAQDGYSWWNSQDSDTWDCLVEPRARIGIQTGVDEAYQRIYFKVKNWTSNIGIQIMRFYGIGAYVINLHMSRNGFTVYIPNVLETYPSHEIIEDDTWYYLEMRFKRANPGGVQIWFGKDGETPSLVYDNMNLDTSGLTTMATAETGIVDLSDQARNNEPSYQAVDMYFDDWVVDTQYIGPSTPSSTSYCGDGTCNVGESQSNCCRDCGCPSGQTCDTSANSCYTPSSTNSVSGSLKDDSNNPVSADIKIYQEGSNTVVEETNTDASGSYSLSVPSSVYDVLYDINNFFINNFWIKLPSLDLSADMVDKLTGVTGDSANNKVSFSVDIPSDQTIQTYSSTEPNEVSIDGIYINKVSSLSNLVSNTWFYDSTNNILYIKTSPLGGGDGGGTTSGILFQDDFSSGNLNNWEIIDGSWSVVSGQLNRETGDSHIKSNTGDSWTDYTFQADLVQVLYAHHPNMIFRLVDDLNYYWVGFWAIPGSHISELSLYKKVNGVNTKLTSKSVSYDIPATAKIEVADEGNGVRIKVYMNDILELNYLENPRTFSAGRIGFGEGYSDCKYDNVVVTGTGGGGGTFCGDGNCDAGETCSNCQTDCGVCAVECNDGIDNDGDENTDYPADSGCSSSSDSDESNCGDGACEGGESCSSCSSDCGDCQTTVFVDTGFESEPSPQKCACCGAEAWSPQSFASDVGDGTWLDPVTGENIVAELYVIDVNDDPSLGRLPVSFIEGQKTMWGAVRPDPAWSTEDFLMHIHYDSPSVNVTWYEMFDPLPSGTSDWLPIFWDFVRKKDSTGQIVQYTISVVHLTLVGSGISVSPASDTNLDFTGATTQSFTFQPNTWYRFNFYHILDATNGRITVKINDVTIFDFTGNTVPKTGSEPDYTYTPLIGFEVGMQYPALSSENTYEFWLDDILATS